MPPPAAPVSLGDDPLPLAPVDAAHQPEGTGASRPAAKRRWGQPTASTPPGSGGETGGPSARASRRVWVRERSTEWWDRLDAPTCPAASASASPPATASCSRSAAPSPPSAGLTTPPPGSTPRRVSRRRRRRLHRLTERNNGKPSYSVAVQAVSDAGGAFTNVYVGLPGSLPDAAVLGSSALCARRRGEAGGLLLGLGQDQRLVGGASYPLTCTDWMLVPYAAHGTSSTGGYAPTRRCRTLSSMITACCVLHNFCQRAGEGLDPDLMQYELDDEEEDDAAAHGATASAAAVQTRDRIAHGLVLHGSHARYSE
ncbi:putative nuclease HARBI1 [Panicum miliaceum]|uniref:Nuclease HARBI1 n=1 Tax=Panicum miliaceum TaxID=4540 RepID=A0A3L6SSQ6_PANMI|nr:putative nuclease HARBI1 [Panicum miliaceum]